MTARHSVRRPIVVWAAAAGVVVGAGLAVPATVDLADHGPTATRPVPRQATADFLAAWRRSRLATFLVVLRFERRTGGGHLVTERRLAQRPPDRVDGGLGAMDARLGGRIVGCSTGTDGVQRCRDGGPARPHEEEVDDEIALLRGYLSSLADGGLYSVVGDGPGCFVLRLARTIPAPPYGTRARFCFDAATGAPVLSEVLRPEGTDQQMATALRPDVSDADLALPVEVTAPP